MINRISSKENNKIFQFDVLQYTTDDILLICNEYTQLKDSLQKYTTNILLIYKIML